MQLIETLPELTKNILYLENKIRSNKNEEKVNAINLMKSGICFVRYTDNGKVFFAPSRFIGYINNSISKHSNNSEKDGSVTNNRIKKILHRVAEPNVKLEKEYFKFCAKYGIEPKENASFGQERKFWNLDDFQPNVYGNIELPEGKAKLRTHIIRERNPRIRQQAIENFLLSHKKVHCEVCGFDFEKKYGTYGKDFIECHHTIPLSKMKKGHKTNSNEIVLLCSNCHRMVHSKKEWLTIDGLRKLIRK